MKKTACKMFAMGLLLLCCVCSAQVSAVAPAKFHAEMDINLSFLLHHSAILDNSKEIRQELLDTNTIYLFAQANGLTKADLATIEIVPGSDTNDIGLYQIRKPDKAFKVFQEQLWGYAENRQAGHSKAFLFTAISNRLRAPVI
ncbi:MAG: hypothetical protein ABSA45_07040, partial [Verrucomicrobiota bacterium]